MSAFGYVFHSCFSLSSVFISFQIGGGRFLIVSALLAIQQWQLHSLQAFCIVGMGLHPCNSQLCGNVDRIAEQLSYKSTRVHKGGAHAVLQLHRSGKGEFHPCEIGIAVSLTVMARIIFRISAL